MEEEQSTNNDEVIDAISKQKEEIKGFIQSQSEEKIPTVIPGTAEVDNDTVTQDQFLSKIKSFFEIKPSTPIELPKQEITTNENVVKEDEDLTPEQEEELKKEYPEINFDKPVSNNEDADTFKRVKTFKRDLYNKLKEKKSEASISDETKSEAKPIIPIEQPRQPIEDKPSITENADKKELPPVLNTPSGVEQKVPAEKDKPFKVEPVVVNQEEKSSPVQTNVFEIKPSASIELPKQQLLINSPTPEEKKEGQPLNQSTELSNKDTSTPVNESSPDFEQPSINIKNNLIKPNIATTPPAGTNVASSATPRPETTTPAAPTNTPEQKPSETISSVKTNLTAEDQTSQQPLKTTNFSENSLDELNKNIVGLTGSVNNILNLLSNATNILANIASKENNVTTINNVAGNGSSSSPKQYQMINSSIEAYRTTFRTPNDTNDILGRTMTPNIPGAIYG